MANQKTARIKIQGVHVVIQAGLNQIEERSGVWAELAWYSPNHCETFKNTHTFRLLKNSIQKGKVRTAQHQLQECYS